MTTDDVAALLAYIRSELPQTFDQIPDGWPGSVELALIDAVLSIQARYGKSADTGVRGAIGKYKAAFPNRDPWNDLGALAQLDADALADVLGNRQVTGGVLKSEAIVNAASGLAAAGAVQADDLNEEKHKSIYTGTKGLGPITWAYLLMLLGHEGVKADTLVSRFVAQAIGRSASPEEVAALVTKAAEHVGVSPTILDHAIWLHMSGSRDN